MVERAAWRFTELGAQVERVDLDLTGVEDVFRKHWFSGAAYLLRNFTAEQKALMDPGLLEVAEHGSRIGMLELIDAVQQRGALGVRMNLFHDQYDLLLTPTLPLEAFDVGLDVADVMKEKRWTEWTPFTYPFNLTQAAGGVDPLRSDEERPAVGLHIVGPRYGGRTSPAGGARLRVAANLFRRSNADWLH